MIEDTKWLQDTLVWVPGQGSSINVLTVVKMII